MDVRPCPFHRFNSLQNFPVLVERDAEIRMQALGIVESEIADVKPVVDADIIVDRGDEMTAGNGNRARFGTAEVETAEYGAA